MKTKHLLLFTALALIGVNAEAAIRNGMRHEPNSEKVWLMSTGKADLNKHQNGMRKVLNEQKLIANATNKSRVDLTSLLVNPDYSIKEGGSWTAKGWTIDGATYSYISGTESNKCCEYWNKPWFDMYQLVQDLPAGDYEVEVNGFYRYTSNPETAWSTYKAQQNEYVKKGGAPVSFYVNDIESPLINVFDEPVSYGTLYTTAGGIEPLTDGEGNWYPNGQQDAVLAFETGMYKQTIAYTVEEGGSLRIGMKGQTNNQSWACWDNFKLIYKNDPVATEQIEVQIMISADKWDSKTTSLDLDDIESKIGTRNFTLYTDQWNANTNQFEWSKNYTQTDHGRAGFWYGRTTHADDSQNMVVTNTPWSSEAGVNSFAINYADGNITWFQYPGQTQPGETWTANLYLFNEENGKYIKCVLNVEFIDINSIQKELIATEQLSIQMTPATDYEWGTKSSLDLDDIENKIGTRNFTLCTDWWNANKNQLEWSNSYTCAPHPGFWYGRTTYADNTQNMVVTNTDWNSELGYNSFAISYANGQITWYQYPGQNQAGNSWTANLYLINLENGKYIKCVLNAEFIEEAEPEPIALEGGIFVKVWGTESYTGSEIKPDWSFTVNEYNFTLVKDRDYEVSYVNNILPGTATISVTGIGNYTGTLTGTFEIGKGYPQRGLDYKIEEPTSPIIYDGQPHGATVTEKKEGVGAITIYYTTAAQGYTDYSTEKPTEVGSYRVYIDIEESDYYQGLNKAWFSNLDFNIIQSELEGELHVHNTYYYTGSEIVPQWNFSVQGYNELVKDKDYSVTLENNILPGTATITVTGIGNYTGTLTSTFEINKDYPNYTVNNPASPIPYDGQPHGATVTTEVGVGAATLYYTTSGQTDYTTEEPIGVGSYDIYLEIAESDLYTGLSKTLVGSFSINSLTLEGELTVTGTYTYTGSEITPVWSFSVEGYNALVEGTDYEVSIVNNILPGTATITVTGMGSYDGTLATTFEIGKANALYNVTLPASNILHDGQPHGAIVSTEEGVGAATLYYTTSGQTDYTTEEPIGVGSYDIYLEIAESDLYTGLSKTLVGSFSIYEEEEPETGITLYVDEDNSETLEENDGETTNVTLNGLTLRQNQWSTLCVPFNATAGQVTVALGDDVDLEELVGSTYNNETMLLTLNFEPRSEITAGVPYMVKVSETVTNPVFAGVTISNTTPDVITTGNIAMTGNYSPTPLTTGDKNTLFIANNHFYYPTTADALPGTKCWFTLNSAQEVKGISFIFDNSPATSIFSIKASSEVEDEGWYTLQGVRVTTPHKGFYIYKGKKVFVK